MSVAAIKIHVDSGKSMLVITVWPTDSAVNLTDFTNCMGEISAIVETNSVESVFILGDRVSNFR